MGIERIISELAALRELDAPTHGGRVLSYVYDSGRAELDELARRAAELTQSLNGLDPTAFPSIAAMERDVLRFARKMLHGDPAQQRSNGLWLAGPVVGSVTSGGTESCLLAVKTARDVWREANPERAAMLARAGKKPRIVTSSLVHAAFQKAARMFDLDWDPVPVSADGVLDPHRVIERLGPDVALVVVSAPAYPSGMIDPVVPVAAAARRAGIACHVDACFGGLVLPWWPHAPHAPHTPPWDFRVAGVTSISADLHKYGYAPKGVSVLLHRGRRRHRAQFFATTRWPGYPVVNPTLLGSKSASPLAAAWAITRHLGAEGYAELTAACARASSAVAAHVGRIPGLSIWGSPTGPALALITDTAAAESERVDPHRLADEVARLGFRLQHQPGSTQQDGTRLPHSAHLTFTPVTERALPELLEVLRVAADNVRGVPRAEPKLELAALRLLGYAPGRSGRYRVPSPTAASTILRLAGVNPQKGSALPTSLAPLMALAEALPPRVAEALLTELLARVAEP